MARKSNRRLTKGWDVDEEIDTGVVGLRERLGASSKLWASAAVVIIGLAALLIAGSLGDRGSQPALDLRENPIGVYTDGEHRKFEADFASLARRRGVPAYVRFTSDKMFRLSMPCDVTNDEIAFLSKSAALGIWRRFHVSPVVQTYVEDNHSSTPKLAAKTSWLKERNDFVVRFEQAPGNQ